MKAVRHLFAQRHFAVLICAAALLLKLLVPAGYMIADDHGTITITVCPGVAPETMAMAGMRGDMSAMHGTMPDHSSSKDHGTVETPCAYAGLSAQMLGAVDPAILAVALVIVAAMALLPVRRATLRPAPYLRPPLRGPPLLPN